MATNRVGGTSSSLVCSRLGSVRAQIFYKDAAGNVFGPFPVEYISAWYQQGYLSDETPLSLQGHSGFQRLRTFFGKDEQPQPHQQHQQHVQQGTEAAGVEDKDRAEEEHAHFAAAAATEQAVHEHAYGEDHQEPQLPPASISVDSIPSSSATFLLPELPEELEEDDGEAAGGGFAGIASEHRGSWRRLLLPPAFRHLAAALQVAWRSAPATALVLVLLRALQPLLVPLLLAHAPSFASMAGHHTPSSTTEPTMSAPLEASTFTQLLVAVYDDLRRGGAEVWRRSASVMHAYPRLAVSLVATAALLAALYAIVYPYLEARLPVLMTEHMQDRLLLAKRHFPAEVIETAGAAGIYLRESLRIASTLLTTLVCAVIMRAVMPAAVDLSWAPRSLQWSPFFPFVAMNLALWLARTARPPPAVSADAVRPLRRYHSVRSKLLARGREGNLPSEWTFGSRLKPLYEHFRRQLPRQARNLPMALQGASAHELAVGVVVAAILVAWLVGQLAVLLPTEAAAAALGSDGDGVRWLRELLTQLGVANASKPMAALAVALLSVLAAVSSVTALAALPHLRRVYNDAVASLDAYSHAQPPGQAGKGLQYTTSSASSAVAAADLTAGVHVADLSVAGPRGPILQNVNMHLPAGQIAVVYGGAGSGKTMLLEAIANRLESGPVRVTGGAVFMFGQQLRAWNHAFLREKMYYMRQQEAPLGLPIDTVVRLQPPDSRTVSTTQHVAEALTGGGALDLPKFLRDGLETDFSDPEAPHLTPGLWRKLAVARALFHAQSADVLLLDSPADAFTEEEEHLFFQFLRQRLRPSQAVVMTTTKAHLCRHADVVVDLDHHTTYTTRQAAPAAGRRAAASPLSQAAHQTLAGASVPSTSVHKPVQ